MPSSKSRSKKSQSDNMDENTSNSLQKELELIALKGKNVDLIKAHAKLLQDNSDMRTQIHSLQADLMNMEVKYKNIHSSMTDLQLNIKKCVPSLIDVLNFFLRVNNSYTDSFRTLNTNFAGKESKTLTQTVKPHTVNGTVLNLNPTISLTRLNTANEESNNLTNNNLNSNYLPSTSNGDDREVFNGDCSPSNLEANNSSFISRRSQKSVSAFQDSELLEFVTKNSVEDEDSSSSDEEQVDFQHLSTIPEEHLTCNETKNFSEVKIYLSPLTAEEIERSLNKSCSSTAANINDTTCLNIETSVIDNMESALNRRLSTGIVVFSPRGNSTRINYTSPLFDNEDTMSSERQCANISALYSPEEEMISNMEDFSESSKLARLVTPSLSAMGDIDPQSDSKIDMLKKLGLEYSPQNNGECSHVSTMKSSNITLRSRSSPYLKKQSKHFSESPRSSRENLNPKRSINTCINQQRGDNGEKYLSPTVVLERLENVSPRRLRLECNSFNNETIQQAVEALRPNTSKSTRSKPSKKSGKRKHIDENVQGYQSIQEKIKEVQQRLSNYYSETSDDQISPENKRPTRAARPKNLKDPSLKKKLRRLF